VGIIGALVLPKGGKLAIDSLSRRRTAKRFRRRGGKPKNVIRYSTLLVLPLRRYAILIEDRRAKMISYQFTD